VIGALTFLVLLEGYVLTGGEVPSLPVIAALTLLVGVVASAGGHVANRRLVDRNG
jgi:tRNA G37 N-methylase TrmD